MSNELYQKLRAQIDRYSVGFPASPSRVEIEILKRLFTEDEAEIYISMGMLPEPVEAIAERMGRDTVQLLKGLAEMVRKGTIFKTGPPETPLFMVAPYMHGIAENNAGNLEPELARLFDRYEAEVWDEHTANLPLDAFVRYIPVGETLDSSYSVAPYNQIEAFLKSKEKIAVIPCFCRDVQNHVGKGCGKPLETCFMFDWIADYVVERGQGRYLSLEEALKHQRSLEEAGLVNMPTNLDNPFAMCHCCGDCCLLLRALNKHSKPADLVAHDYYCSVDADTCSGCESCVERCQIAAISMGSLNTAVVNQDRCIGCGLCISACEFGALKMLEIPDAEKKRKPVTPVEFMEAMSAGRGFSVAPAYADQE